MGSVRAPRVVKAHYKLLNEDKTCGLIPVLSPDSENDGEEEERCSHVDGQDMTDMWSLI